MCLSLVFVEQGLRILIVVPDNFEVGGEVLLVDMMYRNT